jgi:hypothetical protein
MSKPDQKLLCDVASWIRRNTPDDAEFLKGTFHLEGEFDISLLKEDVRIVFTVTDLPELKIGYSGKIP